MKGVEVKRSYFNGWLAGWEKSIADVASVVYTVKRRPDDPSKDDCLSRLNMISHAAVKVITPQSRVRDPADTDYYARGYDAGRRALLAVCLGDKLLRHYAELLDTVLFIDEVQGRRPS